MLFNRLWQDINFRINGRDAYEHLKGDESGTSRSSWLSQNQRRFAILIGFLIASWSLSSVLIPKGDSAKTNLLSARSHDEIPVPGYLHLLMTAPEANVNLCKTILSAGLLGYPTPTLINWGKSQSHSEDDKVKSPDMDKLAGALNYINLLDKKRDDDLVLLVDGYDIWFQLKPEVLIERYRRINAEAEARLQKDLGPLKGNITQKIVFAAQKRCLPADDENDFVCYAVPESPLPKNIYGPRTDMNTSDEAHPHLKYRPRYISPGIAIGTVSAMRDLIVSAITRWNAEPKSFSSDQAVFAQIFAEQEYHRELLRVKNLSRTQKLSQWFTGGYQGILAPHPSRKAYKSDGKPHEYGIGLDYASLLGQVTIFAENDSDWIRYADYNTLLLAAQGLNVTSIGSTEIQEDIHRSRPPFWSVGSQDMDLDLPREMSWENTPLYTNLWTGVTPALIHHNAATEDGKKEAIATAWNHMWFQPYARKMLRSKAYEPLLPVASERVAIKSTKSLRIPGLNAFSKYGRRGGGNAGPEKTWWSPINVTPVDKNKAGFGVQPDDDVKGWMLWTDICKEDDQREIFRDEFGRWMDPKVYPPYPEGMFG